MKNLINKEINAQSLKKVKSSKFLKTCFVGCLATCLTLTGIFAFAPLGTSAQASSSNSNLNNNSTNSTTESTGLITPRADDPVLFTTESGLELKYGLSSLEGSMSSGNLQGYPYFTTTAGSTTYYWVIIGLSSSFNFGSNVLFGLWQQYDSTSTTAQYFFENYFSSGLDIEQAIFASSAYWGLVWDESFVAKSDKLFPVFSDEIPNNCALVLSNSVVGSGVYTNTSSSGSNPLYYGANYTNSAIKSAMDGYYNNSSFGLSSVKSRIKLLSIYSRDIDNGGYNSTNNCYIFPLACSSASTFYYAKYLSLSKLTIASSSQWFRDSCVSGSYIVYATGHWCYGAGYVTDSGRLQRASVRTSGIGYRPAFVMSLC